MYFTKRLLTTEETVFPQNPDRLCYQSNNISTFEMMTTHDLNLQLIS
jgi:hypothetical protein